MLRGGLLLLRRKAILRSEAGGSLFSAVPEVLDAADTIRSQICDPNSAGEILRERGDSNVALRRVTPLPPPKSNRDRSSMGDSVSHGPASMLLVDEGAFENPEGGFQRAVWRGLVSDRSPPTGTLLRPSDVQIHEVYQGVPVLLRSSGTAILGESGLGDHYHFILFRQGLSLLNVIQFLSKTTGGSISKDSFRVNVIPVDASGVVTQRLSVSTRDAAALRTMLLACNRMTVPRDGRHCRLEPIGFQTEPCSLVGGSGASGTLLQYTLMVRNISGSPRKTLSTANSQLRQSPGIPNYFSPLAFGGCQPISMLSALHLAVKGGSLPEAAGMLASLSMRSGWLRGIGGKAMRQLCNDPLSLSAALSVASEDVRSLAEASWFCDALSLACSPSDSVSMGELHEFFHCTLPVSVKRAIKFSTAMLAWNATASAILSNYMRRGSEGGLALPVMDEDEVAVPPIALAKRMSRKSHSDGLRGESEASTGKVPVDGLFDVPLLCLPWDIGREGQSISSNAENREVSPFGLGEDDLSAVLLPVGVHPFHGSLCNVGLAAVGASEAVDGDDCFGYRPLFVPAFSVRCLVCHKKETMGPQPNMVIPHLLTDEGLADRAAARVRTGAPQEPHGSLGDCKRGSRVSTSDLEQRVASKVRKQFVVARKPFEASNRNISHSLMIQFRVPPSTDPSPALASIVSIRSEIPFVPEDNGIHMALKHFTEGECGRLSGSTGVSSADASGGFPNLATVDTRRRESNAFVDGVDHGDGNLLRLRSREGRY